VIVEEVPGKQKGEWETMVNRELACPGSDSFPINWLPEVACATGTEHLEQALGGSRDLPDKAPCMHIPFTSAADILCVLMVFHSNRGQNLTIIIRMRKDKITTRKREAFF
jgi:hypothetical protein